MSPVTSFIDVNGKDLPILRPTATSAQVITNASATFTPNSIIRVCSTATSFNFKFTENGSAVTVTDSIMPTQTVEYFKIDYVNIVLSVSGSAYVATME